MTDEPTRKDGLVPYHRHDQPLRPLDLPATGGAVEYFSNYWRRLSVESKTRVFHALVALIESHEAVIDATISYERALTRLDMLEELRKAEEFRVKKELAIEAARLTNEERHLLIEQMRLDLEYEEAKEALNRKRNPPQPTPQETRDPHMDKLREALYGGGIYTQAAEEMVDDLIRKRGGEDKLKPEDHDRIRNLRMEATRLEQSKGRR